MSVNRSKGFIEILDEATTSFESNKQEYEKKARLSKQRRDALSEPVEKVAKVRNIDLAKKDLFDVGNDLFRSGMLDYHYKLSDAFTSQFKAKLKAKKKEGSPGADDFVPFLQKCYEKLILRYAQEKNIPFGEVKKKFNPWIEYLYQASKEFGSNAQAYCLAQMEGGIRAAFPSKKSTVKAEFELSDNEVDSILDNIQLLSLPEVSQKITLLHASIKDVLEEQIKNDLTGEIKSGLEELKRLEQKRIEEQKKIEEQERLNEQKRDSLVQLLEKYKEDLIDKALEGINKTRAKGEEEQRPDPNNSSYLGPLFFGVTPPTKEEVYQSQVYDLFKRSSIGVKAKKEYAKKYDIATELLDGLNDRKTPLPTVLERFKSDFQNKVKTLNLPSDKITLAFIAKVALITLVKLATFGHGESFARQKLFSSKEKLKHQVDTMKVMKPSRKS